MYGGNPNMKLNKPLQPHHIKQQLGTHNNRGIGGITPGKSAVQSPAPGANLNSTGGIPNPAQHQANLEAGFTVPSGTKTGFASVPPTLPRDPNTGTYLPGEFHPPIDPDRITYYGRAMDKAYGDRIRHFDTMGAMLSQQRMAAIRAASAARRRAEEMQLVAKRDEREAQAGRPRSGTHWLYGF